MCRLLAFVASRPVTVCHVLGYSAFEQFTALSRLHRDGWGYAWADSLGIHRSISTMTADSDPSYRRLARTVQTKAGIMHLRWATDGLAVGADNTHPFVSGGMAFAHNGSIMPISKLEAMMSTAERSHLVGATDSERYFRLIIQYAERFGDAMKGAEAAAYNLRQAFPTASLNGLLLTPDELIAIHASATATPPVSSILEIYPSFVGAPRGHATRYFKMKYRTNSIGTTVASTGLEGSGWSDIPLDSVMAFNRHDLTSRSVSLSLEGAH